MLQRLNIVLALSFVKLYTFLYILIENIITYGFCPVQKKKHMSYVMYHSIIIIRDFKEIYGFI